MSKTKTSAAMTVRSPSSALMGPPPSSGTRPSASSGTTSYSERVSGTPSSGKGKGKKSKKSGYSKRAEKESAGPVASVMSVGKELLPVAGGTLALAAIDTSPMGKQIADTVGAEPSTIVGAVSVAMLLAPKGMMPKSFRKAAVLGVGAAASRIMNRTGEHVGAQIPDFYAKKTPAVAGVGSPASEQAPAADTSSAAATDA